MNLQTHSIEQILDIPFPSYHWPLAQARALARSGESKDKEKAMEFLLGLSVSYPHVLAIGQELVFVLMEQGEHDQAEQALHRFERKFPTLDEEFLSRWGRLFKEKGDGRTPLTWAPDEIGKDPSLAERYYCKSLEKYDKAYRISDGHYPGINKATMLLILGTLRARTSDASAPARVELAESVELAGKILASKAKWQIERPDDETVWFPATQGEAHLLRQEWSQAAMRYREALLPKEQSTFHSRESMRRQVERIVRCFKDRGITPPEPFDDIEALFRAY